MIAAISRLVNAIRQRRLLFVRLSVFKDAVFVLVKGLMGLVLQSFFMVMNAFYSAGMGIARHLAIKMHEDNSKQKRAKYRRIGIIITISAACYVLYSVRLLFGGKSGVYSMHTALVIALYTFAEFGINVREIIRLRKSPSMEAKALLAISFSSTLLCFVLTQTAILSFADQSDNGLFNALSGVAFGCMAAAAGIYVLADSRRCA